MSESRLKPQTDADAGRVVTTAILRAAELLGVRQSGLATILGVSESSVSRLASGDREVDVATKEGELALLFVRTYRSLDAMFGGHVEPSRAWFSAFNDHLGGVPRDLVMSVQGLVEVAQYLDAMRGKV